MQDFTAWEITNIVWALAKMSYEDDALIDFACKRIQAAPDADITPIGACNFLWSICVMTRSGVDSAAVRALTPRLMDKVMAHVDELTPQSVANAAWAGMRLFVIDNDRIEALARRAAAVGGEFKPKELAMFAQCTVQYSTSNEVLREAFKALEPHAAHAIRHARAGSADMHHTIGALFWAYRASGVECNGVTSALVARLPDMRAMRLPAQTIPSLAWGLAEARIHDSALLRQMQRTVVADIRNGGVLTCIEPSMWLWAFAKLRTPWTPAEAAVLRDGISRMFAAGAADRGAAVAASFASNHAPGFKLWVAAGAAPSTEPSCANKRVRKPA
jgi:hypothetical protein